MTQAAIACSLDGRDYQQRLQWIASLNQQYLRTHQREGTALWLTYAMDAKEQVETLLSRERECCPFLEFELRKSEDALVLLIRVPAPAQASADVLLAPFLPDTTAQTVLCCGTCLATVEATQPDGSAPPVMPRNRSNRVAGAAAITTASVALACGVCCVLPIAIPAIALTSTGAMLAWLSGGHHWLSVLAMLVVAAGWIWVGWQSWRSRKRPAAGTLWLMGSATLILIVALSWPAIEPALIKAITTTRSST